jgi:methylglutamate dehydrogenase subunit D
VSSLRLAPRSALDRVLAPGHFGAKVDAAGIFITEHTGLALASVMARKGKTAALRAHVKDVFGTDLPLTPRRVADGPIHFIWAGPDRWLAETETEAPHTFERDLREAFIGLAAVTSQSDGRSVIRVSGARAREMLAKGVPLDLDPRVFGPGDVALTVVAHINVHFWQLDATPTYEFAVFRSFAASFCEWLLDASAEFGAVVDAPAA